jgi:hypothetical protein
MTDQIIRAVRTAQADRILNALETWLAGAPGRSVRLERGPDGSWLATLVGTHQGRGESLADAAAQVAVVASFGADP